MAFRPERLPQKKAPEVVEAPSTADMEMVAAVLSERVENLVPPAPLAEHPGPGQDQVEMGIDTSVIGTPGDSHVIRSALEGIRAPNVKRAED